MKKLSFLLAIILLLSAPLITACQRQVPPEEPPQTNAVETTPEVTTSPTEDTPVVHASISAEQLTKYEVIYAKDSSEEVKGEVKPLIDAIYNTFNIMLNRRTDLYYEGVEAFAKGQYEILIGHTNREESETFLSTLRWDDYGYGIVGDKLVIAGKNEDGTLKALRAFLEYASNVKNGELFFSNADQLLVQKSYPYPTITINGIDASQLSILCNRQELGGVAQIIRDAIIKSCGIAVPIVADADVKEGDKLLVIGESVHITEDAWVDLLMSDEYSVHSNENLIWINAQNASGYYSAALYIDGCLSSNGKGDDYVRFSQGKRMSKDALPVMSFNLKAESKTADYNARTDAVVNTILKYRPAVVGVQEATDQWMNILREKLGDIYTIVGEGRNAEGHDEHSAILYLTDEFDCIESGTKWLSDTPDVKGSKFAESHYTRIMTYAHLSRKSDGKEFLHVNTHLDYGTTDAEEAVKVAQMEVLFEEIAKFSGIPTILTGDFNATVDSPVYNRIQQNGYHNVCAELLETSPTYHGLMGTTGEPSHIDFILHNQIYNDYYLSDMYYRICNERVDNENVSDHYPILTVLAFSYLGK